MGSSAAPRGPVSGGGEAGRARSLAEDVGCGSTGWRGRGGLCAPPILPVVPEIFFVEDPGDERSVWTWLERRPGRASGETPSLVWCFRTGRGDGGRDSDSYLWDLASRGDT